MARTQLQTDWTEDRSAPRGNEWDSLRSELAALLDQVEDRFQLARPEAAPQPATGRSAPKAPRAPEGRHIEALKSVRKAVDRLSDRDTAPGEADPLPPASDQRKSDIAKAISQIRARQGAQPGGAETPQEPAKAPARATPADAQALLKAIGDLGARFERLESQVETQMGAKDPSEDVADQIAQLSEVVELLAGAVGQNSHTQKLEAQIARLAESVAFDRAPEHDTDAVAARLAALAATIEKLTEHQIQSSGRDAEASAAAIERTEGSLHHIEESVRAIYDRIDAMEAARGASTPEIESLSREIAGITAALSERDDSRDSAVLERIDALHARIESLDTAASDPHGLDASIERLRAAVVETMDPRFSALEARLETLDHGPQAPAAPDPAIAGIQDQLKQISKRIEETGVQLESLTRLAQIETEQQAEAPDFDRLADLVAERTRSELHAARPDGGLAASDLDKLEERLSALFSGSGQGEGGSLAGVRDSIANVDTRLARLEATLNGTAPAARAETAAAETVATAPAQPKPRRRQQPDAMPEAPAETETLEIGRRSTQGPRPPQPDLSTLRSETAPAQPAQARAAVTEERSGEPEPFHLDPEAVERPAKPVSSLLEDGESRPQPKPTPAGRAEKPRSTEPAEPEVATSASATRATFIEAARRAARQQQESQPEPEEPKSLIGRALARFQRSESDESDLAQPEPNAGRAEAIPTAPQVEAEPHPEETPDKRSSFLKRHRRPLLLSAALVVVVLLSANLVSQRMSNADGDAAGSPSAPEANATAPAANEATTGQQGSQDPAPVQEPAPEIAPPEVTTPAAPEPAAAGPQVLTMPQGNPLTSPVSFERQDAGLSGGTADGPLAYGPTTDPLTTASVGDADAAPAANPAEAETATAQPALIATLPDVAIPDAIEPADLRAAAAGGDKEALFEVAAILTEGQAVTQDLESAAALYERAAVKGYAPAQYRLGNLYETGGGVDKDLELARQWYERAAEAGNRMAMHNLASLYAGGELENQDFEKAAHWFEQAATRGMTDSQFNLGMLYARGLGVEQSFAQSYVWFSLAANSGDSDAGQARDDVSRSIDPDTVQALDDRVAAWTPKQIAMQANFAPIGTWSDDFDPGQAIENHEVVLRVQQLLGKLGYDVGQADGLMGPQTRSAIRSFERETGMSESGAVNPRLLAVLGSQPV